MTSLVEGIDVSHWQTPGLVLPPATRFAWVKASQGDESTDKAMRRHHDELGKDGIARGPYHFYECNDTPEGNASKFLAATAGLHWELPHALDYENASGSYGSKSVNAAKLLTFLRLIEAGTGRIPVVYTGKSWWDPMVAPDQTFTRYPVWVARYPKPNDGTLPPTGKWTPAPAPWPVTTVWQYSDTSGRLDRNICSQASFALLTGTTSKPAPVPPNGEDLTMADINDIMKRLDTQDAALKRIEKGILLDEQSDSVAAGAEAKRDGSLKGWMLAIAAKVGATRDEAVALDPTRKG